MDIPKLHLFIQQLFIETHHESMQLLSTENRHKIITLTLLSTMCGRIISVKQGGLEPYSSGLRLGSGDGKCKAT